MAASWRRNDGWRHQHGEMASAAGIAAAQQWLGGIGRREKRWRQIRLAAEITAAAKAGVIGGIWPENQRRKKANGEGENENLANGEIKRLISQWRKRRKTESRESERKPINEA